MQQTNEIMDGVRRAKAALLAGHQAIRAKLFAMGTSKFIQEFDVPIADLRSPHKTAIRRISRSDQARWRRVVAGAMHTPLLFPPIEVVEGGRGVKVHDTRFDTGLSP